MNNQKTFIKLDATKNSAGGNGGCNSFGSNYIVNEQQLDFKNIFSTKMFCEQFQSQENNFFKQLELVNRYDVKDGKLLCTKDNELLLELGK